MKSKNNILKEVFSKGYFSRAQIRAKRRRSPWNLILIPLVIGGIGSVCYGLFQVMWRIHTIIYPEHIGRFNEFWQGQDGLSARSFVSSFLLIIPLFFASIPLGLILANLIAWCIPPARQAFEKEAKGHKFTSFKEAMTGLFQLALVIVPICLVLSLIGAITLKRMK